LKGKAIDDIIMDFDVYVTDNKLVRNFKLLSAIANNVPVVSVKWLMDSHKSKEFSDDFEKYLIIDKEFEKTHKCDLK
jgi:hypothetical protein